MKNYTIASIGELLWDVLPDDEILGGAPVNFAYHVTALGARGIPVSTVGRDPRGERAVAELRRRGVETAAISVAEGVPTGYVDIALDHAGIAYYRFPPELAWDHLQVNEFARGLRDSLDAVCFGTLAQRLPHTRHVIHEFLDGLKPETLKIFDVNLRQNLYSREILESSLERCDLVKLNDQELPVLADLLGLGEGQGALSLLLARFRLRMAILTRGGSGSMLVTESGFSDHPGVATQVVDTIGAGDAFTAAVAIGYLDCMELDHINEEANRLAAYVCARRGAMPEIPEPFRTDRAMPRRC